MAFTDAEGAAELADFESVPEEQKESEIKDEKGEEKVDDALFAAEAEAGVDEDVDFD